jgi:hypothetical protein
MRCSTNHCVVSVVTLGVTLLQDSTSFVTKKNVESEMFGEERLPVGMVQGPGTSV